MGAIIPVVLLVGVVAGAFNGFLVAGLPSLAVTIVTLTLTAGSP